MVFTDGVQLGRSQLEYAPLFDKWTMGISPIRHVPHRLLCGSLHLPTDSHKVAKGQDHVARAHLAEDCTLCRVKYLNNIIEQDHRFIKRLVRPGLGFGSFMTAMNTLSGYETMHMIRKGQMRGIATGDSASQELLWHRSSDWWHEARPQYNHVQWSVCLVFHNVFATQPDRLPVLHHRHATSVDGEVY